MAMIDDKFLEEEPPRHQKTANCLSVMVSKSRKSYRKPYAPKRTHGRKPYGPSARVYLMQSTEGRLKIGFSECVLRRAKAIGEEHGTTMTVLFSVEVASAAVFDVEGIALTLAGRESGESEWVYCGIESAVTAINSAVEAVSRFKRTDPNLTDEQAKAFRIQYLTR